MSRILLLLPFLIWMSRTTESVRLPDRAWLVTMFLGVYALLILTMTIWARLLARRISDANLRESLRRFNFVMMFARFGVPIWYGFGVFTLYWKEICRAALPAIDQLPFELPMLVIGTLPAFIAWAGLWWAQFPADQALREQGALSQLENDIPVHRPPSLWQYLESHLRLQFLFTLLPVLMIILTRDLIAIVMKATGRSAQFSDATEAAVMFASAALVLLLAPELLRRVLKTESFPQSELRTRLEALCVRNRLKYRDILLWRTNSQMGNAAVMGVVPRVRYILMSDLLLETMTDEQIEAVFAHELGHIVHRHMAWYVVVFLIILAGTTLLESHLDRLFPSMPSRDIILMIAGLVTFVMTFGFLSRRFERQADVFAARTVEMTQSPTPAPLPMKSFVGRHGANVFASALRRVAIINNMPTDVRARFDGNIVQRVITLVDFLVDNATHWLHGSIESRVQVLQRMSGDPALTAKFDRRMARVYVGLLCLLCMLGAWIVSSSLTGR